MYQYFLRRKLKKIITRNERERSFQNMNEIKSILLLFDSQDIEDATYIIQQLKQMGKRIKTVVFKSKKDKNEYSNIKYAVLTERDIKGDALEKLQNSLLDEKIDLVVDFTLRENLILLSVLVTVNAPLKVGFYKHALPVHDIVIPFSPGLFPSVKELGTQLIHYLTIISSGIKK